MAKNSLRLLTEYNQDERVAFKRIPLHGISSTSLYHFCHDGIRRIG